MQDLIAQSIDIAFNNLSRSNQDYQDIPSSIIDLLDITTPNHRKYGDYSCNIAFKFAKKFAKAPIIIAEQITKELNKIYKNDKSYAIAEAKVAGAGFINFYIEQKQQNQLILDVINQGDKFGENLKHKGKKALIEFVSANPTGPLHIGHGRGAAYGDSLARLFVKNGYKVTKEYYINDAGRQIDILTISVFLRMSEIKSKSKFFPTNLLYQGEYLIETAKKILNNQFSFSLPNDILSLDSSYHKQIKEICLSNKNIDILIDELIIFIKNIISKEVYVNLSQAIIEDILDTIKKQLKNFKVNFDSWFYESSLYQSEENKKSVLKTLLQEIKHDTYIKDGAVWFKTNKYGDSKDRVLLRENGQYTYFASDIGYHYYKFKCKSKYDVLINVWGADHHGYIARVRAALSSLNLDNAKLELILVQFAVLYRNKQKISMSTRSGEFVDLNDLINEVGVNASRFFYCMRKQDNHLDFDLDIATAKNNQNPLYYINYAYARVQQLFARLKDQGLKFNIQIAKENLDIFNDKKYLPLLQHIHKYPNIIQRSCKAREPHLIAFYLKDLAALFHSFYNSNKILSEEINSTMVNLLLAKAVAQTIKNGLSIFGIIPQNKM